MQNNSSKAKTKVKRLKNRFGLYYGLVAGLAFSITLWGVDGWILSRSFAYLPWVKFIAGGLLALPLCGLVGWLTSLFEKPLLGILLWIAAAFGLAWLAIVVPIAISPAVMKTLNPALAPFLHYTFYNDASQMLTLSFAWILVAAFIIAVIQVPMLEQAAFSTSILGRVAPNLIAAFLMLASGSVADSLSNQSLRDSLTSMNETIRFSLDARGHQIDPQAAREVHLASLRTVENLVSPTRRLVVSRYDSLQQTIYILINFNGNWVECSTIFNHPLNCEAISP